MAERAKAGAIQAAGGAAKVAAKPKGAGPREKKEKKPKDPFEDQSPMGLFKREAAEKLGLVEKILSQGWGGLSAAESGRVGALVNRILRERRGDGNPADNPADNPRGDGAPRGERT